jgi:3-hydroxyacyl-CoA dehydrogenase
MAQAASIMQSSCVRVEHEDEVAVVIIDNPPINAGSFEVRSGLLAAIEAAGKRPDIKAIVVIGDGTTFIAGSDLREFGQPIAEPSLPAVIAAIESCNKPVVAALHGAALGGGFELALGCDARIALTGTVVGLPEVTLGIIPGAGGTQRLPRLVGIPKAITMICSGERVPADAALTLNLIDKVVTTDLRSAAIAYARAMNGRKHRVRDLTTPECDDTTISTAATSALRAGKNRPAVHGAIAAVTAARTLPMEEALARERTAFLA